MSEPIPCPACGTTQPGGETACRVCGYALDQSAPNNAGTGRCARCGTDMSTQFDFCPICGLDQRRRLSRPSTGALRVSSRGERLGSRAPQPGHGPPSLTPTAPPSPGAANADPAVGATLGATGEATGKVGKGIALDVPIGNPALSSRPAVQPGVASSGQVAAVRAVPVASASASASAFPASARPRPAGGPTGWASAGRPPRLVCVERDGSEGRSFPMTGNALVIGRTQGDVVIGHDPFVSPFHARLERDEEGRFFLVDSRSRNGVYLRITRPEPVYPGDLFLVGHQLLRLENVDGAGEQPADSDGTRGFGTPVEPSWGCLSLVGRGSMVGDVYQLRKTEVILGRESGDILFPDDRFLSRQHARLVLQVSGQSMSVCLEDLGSANGTYLRLRGRASVGANDTFRVGDQILRIKTE